MKLTDMGLAKVVVGKTYTTLLGAKLEKCDSLVRFVQKEATRRRTCALCYLCVSLFSTWFST